MTSPNHQRERLEQLFRQHYAMLVQVSVRLTRDQALSEDVVQNVFLRFLERDDHPRGSLRRYLARFSPIMPTP